MCFHWYGSDVHAGISELLQSWKCQQFIVYCLDWIDSSSSLMLHRRPMLHPPRHADCHPTKYKLPHRFKAGSSSHHPRSCSQRLHLISSAPPLWHSKTITLLRELSPGIKESQRVLQGRRQQRVVMLSGHNLSGKRVAISISTIAQSQRNHESIFSE